MITRFIFPVDDKNDPSYAPPRASEIGGKRARRSSDFNSGEIHATSAEMTSSYVTSPKAGLMKGVLHAVQSNQHPSVRLRSPSGKLT